MDNIKEPKARDPKCKIDLPIPLNIEKLINYPVPY